MLRNYYYILMSQWSLSMQFLKNDMDRIDHPAYFMKDFQSNELTKFFQQIQSPKQISQHRQSINLFFDRFLSMNPTLKTVYVQTKWVLILHQIIQKFKQGSPLYGYTFKALQVCTEDINKLESNQNPFEKYLLSSLIKPYIQYLSKLCLLNMPAETIKYDKNSVLSLSTKPQEDGELHEQNTEERQAEEQQDINMKLIDWYRRYNFITEALQTFQHILTDLHRFFKAMFPFLNHIGRTISQDLNNLVFKLKYSYRSLKKSNVTLIEIDQLQNKLKIFTKRSNEYLGEYTQFWQQTTQFSKNDLQQFLMSPLKPNQLRLYTKKSIGTPLLNFVKS